MNRIRLLAAVLSLLLLPQAARAGLPTPAAPSPATLALGLGLGAAAWATSDYRDADSVERTLDRRPIDGPIDLGNWWGSGTTAGLGTLGLLALGRVTDHPALSAAGKDLSISFLGTWAGVWALKLSVNAKRPNGGHYSFPSGHTATAFAAAPVLARHFGPKIGYPAYGLAVLTGLARMEDRKHYLSDVLAGAAIGFVIGREVSGRRNPAWTISPSPQGVAFSFHF